MQHSENEKAAFRKKRKERAQFLKKKESVIIAAKKNISLGNADRPKLITRKSTILKKNESERLRKSLK
jgi:hypothetical protein